MTLETDFPNDPTQPSLRYAVSTRMPLAIPWTNSPMRVGGCLLHAAQGSEFQFGNEYAFDMESLSSTPMVFTEMHAMQVSEATTSGSSNSHRSLSADIASCIGGSVVGGSARGQYNMNSNQNEDVCRRRPRNNLPLNANTRWGSSTIKPVSTVAFAAAK